MRASTRKGYREIIESDLEIMPLMNLFVALIPMLLISAVFLNVTVIDMHAPPDVSENDDGGKEQESLALAVTIKDDHFVVEGNKISTKVIVREEEDADVQLGDALAAISARFPDNSDIMIISQSHTRYSDIISVMDISRDAGLPAVSLLGAN